MALCCLCSTLPPPPTHTPLTSVAQGTVDASKLGLQRRAWYISPPPPLGVLSVSPPHKYLSDLECEDAIVSWGIIIAKVRKNADHMVRPAAPKLGWTCKGDQRSTSGPQEEGGSQAGRAENQEGRKGGKKELAFVERLIISPNSTVT